MSSGFVSEGDLAERRRVRKEMWESTRTEDDPEEPPEEPVPDHRTLFDRLKEQKDKKQEDWEEAHKLKNMVRGLEDDEVDFLELVDNTKMQEEKRIKTEENIALKEYRKKVCAMQQKASETEVLAELRPEGRKTSSGVPRKSSSQLSLLAGAIKRKRSADEDASAEEAPAKDSTAESSDKEKKGSPSTAGHPPPAKKVGLQCVAVLPGLGVYTDSSDSDDDSNSDSDLEASMKVALPRDITGRIQYQAPAPGAKGFC